MLFTILISIVGQIILNRIILKNFNFSPSKSKIAIHLSLILVLICSFYIKKAYLTWFIIGFFQITLIFFLKFEEKQFMRSLNHEFIPILDRLIISMSTGKSFKQSFLESIKTVKPEFHQIIIQTYNKLNEMQLSYVRPQSSIENFIQELIFIEKNQSKCLEKAKTYRRKLQIIKNFRRKSGQVRVQSQVQSLVMLFLYLGLLMYIQFEFGISKHLSLVMISIVFFTVGLFGVLNIGRRMKWKV